MAGTTRESASGSSSPDRSLAWRLGAQLVAINPSAALRSALRMWLPRTAAPVDHFCLVSPVARPRPTPRRTSPSSSNAAVAGDDDFAFAAHP